MRTTGWLLGLGFACLSFLSCTTRNACAIRLGQPFEGNVVVLMDGADTQDGRSMVYFFPVCQLDTVNLLESLTQATRGIVLDVDHQKLAHAFRNRGLALTKSDTRLPRPFRRVYTTSAHVAFTDTGGTKEDADRLTLHFKLRTDRINYEQDVLLLDHAALRATSFAGI